MTDVHLDILRAMARGRMRRLAADARPPGVAEDPSTAEGPSTEHRSELQRRSDAARGQLSRARARRRSSDDA